MRKLKLEHVSKIVDYLSQFSFIEVSNILNYFLKKDENKIVIEENNKFYLCEDRILNLCLSYLSNKTYKDVYHLISYIYSSEEIKEEIELVNEE